MTNQKSFSARDRAILNQPKAALVAYLEDAIDKEAVKSTDFKKGKNFEKVASRLGI